MFSVRVSVRVRVRVSVRFIVRFRHFQVQKSADPHVRILPVAARHRLSNEPSTKVLRRPVNYTLAQETDFM